MSGEIGYIKLYRKLRDNPLWVKPLSRAEAWIDILMEVRYEREPRKVLLGSQIVECHYAESLYSIRTWGDRWGWDESKVRRFLIMLAGQTMIEREGVGNSTRVKVLNYERYASGDMTHDEPVTNPCMTRDEPVTTTKEGKEGNKEKKKEDMSNELDEEALKIPEVWNEMAGRCGVPCIRKLDAFRRRAIRSRWGDKDWRKDWREAISKIGESEFACGGGNQGWRATFNWFLKPKSVTHILEGNYDGKKQGGVGRPDQLQDKGQYDPQKLANSFSSEE